MRRTAGLGLALLVGLLGFEAQALNAFAPQPAEAAVAAAGPERLAAEKPLAGKVVVLDPGHQLGNHHFPAKINRPVPAGRGRTKPCNTTGTSTNGGYPEATFTWQVARLVERRLERLGAKVVLTRHSNRQDRWGPCVDVRGRSGNRIGADLLLSIHGDGSYAANARGFHVITAPGRRVAAGMARDVRASLKRAGIPVANYIAGGDGLDVRDDLATLNLARVPAVMVELGNMRDARDARRMTRPAGRRTYAQALAGSIARSLG